MMLYKLVVLGDGGVGKVRSTIFSWFAMWVLTFLFFPLSFFQPIDCLDYSGKCPRLLKNSNTVP